MRKNIILNIFWTGVDRNSNFNSALVEILLGLEWPGMSHYYVLSKSKQFLHWHQYKICLQCWKGVGRPTRLLPHTKMLLDPNYIFFLWRVYYALEGYICDFSCLFHTGRSWHAYWFSVVFISGWHDLPSDARAFSLTYFEVWKLLIGAK